MEEGVRMRRLKHIATAIGLVTSVGLMIGLFAFSDGGQLGLPFAISMVSFGVSAGLLFDVLVNGDVGPRNRKLRVED